MLKFTLFITIFIHLSCGYSQLQIDWVTQMGSVNDEIVTDIDVDSIGNIYTTGDFKDSVDTDPGQGTYYLYNSFYYGSPFIMKQAPNGDLLWANAIGDGGKGIEVEVDDAGNTWVLCRYYNSDTIDIDPGPGITNISADPGNPNLIICKYNSIGEFQWVQQFSGFNGGGLLNGSIEVDDYGNCYAGGTLAGSVNFNHDEPIPYNLSGNMSQFISKIDSSGNVLWVKKFGGSSYTKGIKDMKMDNSDNLVIIGDFTQWNDYDPGPGNVDYYCNDCVFNIKIDSSGSFIWGLHFASDVGSADQSASALVIDSLNNIYQVGQFNGGIDFDPGPGIVDTFAIGSVNTQDSYIVKLDSNGTYLWHGVIVDPYNGGGGSTVAVDIDIDSEGYIYSTGIVESTYDPISLSPFGDTNYVSFIGRIEFINKIDPVGELVWVHPRMKVGNQFKIDPFNNIIIAGNFQDIYDFGTTFYGTYVLNAFANGEDIFVKKLRQCDGYSASYLVSDCNEYYWPVNDSIYTQSGTFIEIFPNQNGCDSIFTLNLDLTSIDTNLNVSGYVLTSNSAVGTYVWVDCGVGTTIIPGETDQSYTVTHNGSYAVMINYNGCITMSECITFDDFIAAGILDEESYSVSVYPNPLKGDLINIETVNLGMYSLKIMSSDGRIVFAEDNIESALSQIYLNESPGLYLIQLQSINTTMYFKFIKEN